MTSSCIYQDISKDGGTNMKLYFIATIENLDFKGEFTGGDGKRVPGFFETQEKAIEVVEKNKCDICEGIYKYAVIEGLEPGLYPDDFEPLFYKWIDGRYQRIEKPKEWESLCGFTIG